MCLWPFACWNCEFKFCWGHGCLPLLSVVCFQVDAFASDWSRVQRSPTGVWCVCVWSWSHNNEEAPAHKGLLGHCGGGGDVNTLSMLHSTYSRCIKEGSIQASWCMVLPWVTSRVQECSNVCFSMCKIYLFMSIHNKTENKCNLSGINLNVMLKCYLTEPWI
jgi:hypothetical protein